MARCDNDVQKFAYTKKDYPLDYPLEVQKGIKLLSINPKNVLVFGTSSIKSMLYAGDIDLREFVPLKDHAKAIQKMVKQIISDKDYGSRYILGDIKAGNTKVGEMLSSLLGDIINCQIIDYNPNELRKMFKELKINKNVPDQIDIPEWIKLFKVIHDIKIIRWTPDEILKGVHHTGVNLKQATLDSDLNKVDMYFYYNGKYVEMTTVLDYAHGIVEDNNKIIKGLKLNLLSFLYKEPPNYLKVIKRANAISRLTGNCNYLSKVKDFLVGNVALLNSVKNDLDVLPEMIARGFDINKNKEKLNSHISMMISRLSNVYVVDIPDEMFLELHKIQESLQDKRNIDVNKMLEFLENISDSIGEVVNCKTLEFINSSGISFKEFC